MGKVKRSNIDVKYEGNIKSDTSVPIPTSVSPSVPTSATPSPVYDKDKYNADAAAMNNVVASATPTMTYAQYLEQSKGNAENIYNKSVAAIDKSSADALTKIEEDRQAGIRNANAAYEQSKATYGANAESLRRMGLTGSGYSDYLTASAYAASRGEIANVNAMAQDLSRAATSEAEQQKLAALTTYEDNLRDINEKSVLYSEQEREKAEAKDAEKTRAYNELLIGIDSGEFKDKETIRQLALNSGLSYEEAEQLGQKAQTKIAQEQDNNYATYLENIDNGEIMPSDIAKIEADKTSGKLSEIGYENLKEAYLNMIDSGDDFFTDDYGDLSQASAEAKMQKLLSTGWVTEDDQIYKELQAAYNKKYVDPYTAKTGETGNILSKVASAISGNENGVMAKRLANDYTVGSHLNLDNVGRNIAINIDSKTYKLESGGRVESQQTYDALKTAAKDVPENTLFTYGNNLYVKRGNNFYYIVGRNGSTTGDYSTVKNKIKNQ